MATITYVGGGMASIMDVPFQDTDGPLYLAPEMSENTASSALEVGQIESLHIVGANDNTALNFAADRYETQ